MSKNTYYLFVDTEATGLNFQKDLPVKNKMLQIAWFLTDDSFNKITTPSELEIEWSDENEFCISEWAKEHHTKSGLIDKCKKYGVPIKKAEAIILKDIESVTCGSDNKIILAGSTISYDKELIRREMPTLFNKLYYRTFDVSTVLMFMKTFKKNKVSDFISDTYKNKTHTALSDITDSLDLLYKFGNLTDGWNTDDYSIGKYNTGNRNTGYWNVGDDNTGYWNVGHGNTGCWNVGNQNKGGRNTGNRNTGDWNTSNHNTGNHNIGYRNTGDYNTGNRNMGNRNTGNWNISNDNTGCFNTIEPKMMLFNKPSNITLRDWKFSTALVILDTMPDYVNWIWEIDMTEEEKEENPSYKTTGGYLKKLSEEEVFEKRQQWFNNLSDDDKELILSIPNFDAEIFKQCTGIDVEAEGE